MQNIEQILIACKQERDEFQKKKQLQYEAENPTCVNCYNRHKREDFRDLPCGHKFCIDCLTEWYGECIKGGKTQDALGCLTAEPDCEKVLSYLILTNLGELAVICKTTIHHLGMYLKSQYA